MTPRSACATCPTCGRRPSERFGAATVEMGVSSLGPDGSFSYQKTGDMPTGGVTARCDDHCHSLADAAPELLAALKLCAAVLAGETLSKSRLIEALESAQAAIKAAQEPQK